MSEKKPSFGGILEAVRWAFEQQGIGAGETMVLVALATHADADGACFPSVGRLAEMSKQSKPTVRRHLNRLETLNLIGKESGFRRDGSQSSNLYRLKPPRGDQSDSPPNQSDSPPDRIDTPGVQNEQGRVSKSAPHEQPNNDKKDSPSPTPSPPGQGFEENRLVFEKEAEGDLGGGMTKAANPGARWDEAACQEAVAAYDEVAKLFSWPTGGWPLTIGRLGRLKDRLKDFYTIRGNSLSGWQEALEWLVSIDDKASKISKSLEFLLGSGRLGKLMAGEMGGNRETGWRQITLLKAAAIPWRQRSFDEQLIVIGKKYTPELWEQWWRADRCGPIEEQSPEILAHYGLTEFVERTS